MSCADINEFGMCDGEGRCAIVPQFSCPETCERNIIAGCHNYTLNPTHPCTDENLCHYEITLLVDCLDQPPEQHPICLPQHTTVRDTTNHLNVHIEECVESESWTNGFPASSLVCSNLDLVLIEHTPQKISNGLGSNEPIFLEFSPGIPAESSSEYYPGYDGAKRVCVSEWLPAASHPYCAYTCYPQANIEYVSSFTKCEGQSCTTEVRRLMIKDPDFNLNTDNNS